MRVTIDEQKCIGAGLCVETVASVFSQRDDDGIVVLLDANPPPEVHIAVRHAARACPALAITVEED